MALTANKQLNNQNTGVNNNTWGIVLNANNTLLDSILSGVVTVNCAGNSNIVVSTSQSQNVKHILTGALTGNINYIFPYGGFYFVDNQTTGAFSVTATIAGATASVVCPQGAINFVCVDATTPNVKSPGSSSGGAVVPWSVASGTADVITAVYSPANSALTDGLLLSFRASGANTITTPTFAPDGLPPHVITKDGGIALVAGDIPGNLSETLVRYNLANTRWELLNPASIIPSAIPSGAGMDWWGSSAPSGFIFAYGQAINRVTYSDLFAVYGVTYGSGDGSTTFNVPDKRGRTSFGVDNMGGSAAGRLTSATMTPDGNTAGAVGGNQQHANTTGEMASHTHTANVTDPGHTHVASAFKEIAGSAGGTVDKYNSDGNNASGSPVPNPPTGSAVTGISVTNSSAGSGTAYSILPPGIVCNYIIKT